MWALTQRLLGPLGTSWNVQKCYACYVRKYLKTGDVSGAGTRRFLGSLDASHRLATGTQPSNALMQHSNRNHHDGVTAASAALQGNTLSTPDKVSKCNCGRSSEVTQCPLPSPPSLPSRLPHDRTPSRTAGELHLPNYSSIEVLRTKLMLALAHIDDGFLKD